MTNSTSNVVVTLHNTTPGRAYKLWNKPQLVATQAWILETNLTGASGQDWTATTVPMQGRSNLFFLATALGNFATNKSFPGLQFTNSSAGNPDSMGAVGPDHFVEILNGTFGGNSVAVSDKCSSALVQQVTNRQFFAVQRGGTNVPLETLVDPRVVYDSQAQRWVACALEQSLRVVVLAVSKNNSPLDLLTNWTKHLISFEDTNAVPDYPTLGIDKHGIYLSILEFGFSGGVEVVSSNVVVAFKKPDIYDSTNIITSVRLIVPTNDLPATVIQPAVNFDDPPRGSNAWFVAKRWRENSGSYQGGAFSYRRLQWIGTNAQWADTNWMVVKTRSIATTSTWTRAT